MNRVVVAVRATIIAVGGLAWRPRRARTLPSPPCDFGACDFGDAVEIESHEDEREGYRDRDADFEKAVSGPTKTKYLAGRNLQRYAHSLLSGQDVSPPSVFGKSSTFSARKLVRNESGS